MESEKKNTGIKTKTKVKLIFTIKRP